MKKQSTSSKSQVSSMSRRLKQVPFPEEVLPANVSKKHPKRRKISEDTSSPERENTTGLAILPDELLLEILPFYSDSEPELNEDIGRDADAHFARRERLIALSQTCRNLRRFLRPYVWCRIEVFTGMRVSTGVLKTKRQLALELIRQLEIVTIRDPGLAEYVNVVNVMIGDYSVGPVLQELARCLAIFPNVHTFKLSYTQVTMLLRQAITRVFSHCKAFPQIHSITVPKECISLVKYFPGARRVNIIGESRQALSAYNTSILACCPLMENISLVIPSSRLSLPHIVQQFPNIRDITIQLDWISANTQTDLDFVLSNFRYLKIIKLHLTVHTESEKYNQIKSQAEKPLLGLQKRDKEEKTLILYRRFGYEKITLPWPPILLQLPNDLP